MKLSNITTVLEWRDSIRPIKKNVAAAPLKTTNRSKIVRGAPLYGEASNRKVSLAKKLP
jgi:hypothetical protein